MSNLWSYLKSRISKAENSTATRPLIQESVDIISFPVNRYEKWLGNESILSHIKKAHIDFFIERSHDPLMIDFMSSSSSNGFIIYANGSTLSNEEMENILYHFYLKLKAKSYILNIRDKRTRKKADWLEKIDRYYLKPSIRLPRHQDNQVNQLYGNVLMENVYRDGKPYLTKVLCNSYNDRQYSEPLPFSDLLNYICEK